MILVEGESGNGQIVNGSDSGAFIYGESAGGRTLLITSESVLS